MRKSKKIILTVVIALLLAFILQKSTNFYIERQINSHLAPYKITAELAHLNKLTLNYHGLSLTCKIKIEDKTMVLVPVKNSVATKLLPDKIKIPLN